MPLVPAAFVNKQEIRQTSDDVVSTLSPDVVFVGYKYLGRLDGQAFILLPHCPV